jgi:hypothetical protein
MQFPTEIGETSRRLARILAASIQGRPLPEQLASMLLIAESLSRFVAEQQVSHAPERAGRLVCLAARVQGENEIFLAAEWGYSQDAAAVEDYAHRV